VSQAIAIVQEETKVIGPAITTPSSSTHQPGSRSTFGRQNILSEEVKTRLLTRISVAKANGTGLNFLATARQLGIAVSTVRRWAEENDVPSKGKGASKLAEDQYAQIDLGLFDETLKTKIAQMVNVDLRTVSKRHRDVVKKYAGLDMVEVQDRLREIINGVFKHENILIAANNLRLTRDLFLRIRYGLQDFPIAEAKNWAAVIETNYARTRAWEDRHSEYRQLVTYARTLPIGSELSQTFEASQNPPIVNMVESGKTDIGAATRWLREAYADTRADLVTKMQDPKITIAHLGAIESQNTGVTLEIYERTANHMCRIYGAEAWKIAQKRNTAIRLQPSLSATGQSLGVAA
jgi:hypothetical protein